MSWDRYQIVPVSPDADGVTYACPACGHVNPVSQLACDPCGQPVRVEPADPEPA